MAATPVELMWEPPPSERLDEGALRCSKSGFHPWPRRPRESIGGRGSRAAAFRAGCVMRHSLVQYHAVKAVQKLFPGCQAGIGPWIERTRFYYDFDPPRPLTLTIWPRSRALMQPADSAAASPLRAAANHAREEGGGVVPPTSPTSWS
jgi:hypothetical protein